jgi:uncharacterized membrane protein YraQ (UPF0718 family)
MREIFAALVDILRESSPYLILGFALAGVIHVILQRFPRIMASLTGPGKRPIFMAALLGAPMPLCSCSVVPAALALRREGASKGTTASFLVSDPETDIVSVLVTLALIGPFVAVYRPLAGVVTALATGLVIHALERRELRRASAAASSPLSVPSPIAASCCEETPTQPHGSHTPAGVTPSRRGGSWRSRAFHYGFIEIFDDIVPQMLLGIAIAALIGVVLPDINPHLAGGNRMISYFVMVAVGIPIYVCAAASTPIAAGLIASGVSPGAAMVFLLAGPATNIGSLLVLRNVFGTRMLAVYVLMIAVSSILFGALLDLLVGSVHVTAVVPAHEHGGSSPLGTICTLLFLGWVALSFHRSRLLQRMRAGLARMLPTRPSMR